MPDEILSAVGEGLVSVWWLIAFAVLAPLFKSTWIFWRQETFKFSSEFKCVLLELKIPREVKKSPRAMEQVFSSIHGLGNYAQDLREIWWDGERTRWYSLEMVSFGGEIRFFARVYYKQRALLESSFFSYYPDVELVEVEDYVHRFPQNVQEMRRQGYEMWGTEMVLSKEEAYPIKTYLDFESPDEEKQYDPIAAFLEVLGKVKKEEIVGIQFLIQPSRSEWKDKWEDLVEKLRKKHAEEENKRGGLDWDFSSGPLPAVAAKTSKDEGIGALKRVILTRTPGETKVLEELEENLSLLAFNTLIRFVYFSPKPLFYESFARRGLAGAFRQFATLDLNRFERNDTVSTRTKLWHWPHIFPKRRKVYRQQRLLYNYRHREMPLETQVGKLLTSYFLNWNFASRTYHMTTRCLATLFHPPTHFVLTAPHMQRVESRKTGPPAGLAIFGEEEAIEKYR